MKSRIRNNHGDKVGNKRLRQTSSAAIEIQALGAAPVRVALRTICKVNTELRNNFTGEKSRFARWVIPKTQICRGQICTILQGSTVPTCNFYLWDLKIINRHESDPNYCCFVKIYLQVRIIRILSLPLHNSLVMLSNMLGTQSSNIVLFVSRFDPLGVFCSCWNRNQIIWSGKALCKLL